MLENEINSSNTAEVHLVAVSVNWTFFYVAMLTQKIFFTAPPWLTL